MTRRRWCGGWANACGRPVRTVQPRSCSAHRIELQQMRPLVQRVVDQTRARLLGGDTHVARQSPERLRTAHRDDSQGQDLEAERVRQPRHHSRIGTSDHHGVRRPREATRRRHVVDRRAWIGIRAIFGRAPDLAAGDRGFSSATNEQAATDRGVRRVVLPRRGPKSPRDAPMNANAGSGAANAGASAAKVASVCSNGDMDSTAVATMASTACTAGSASASSPII